MAIYQLNDRKPVIPASCYISEEATIIGSVILGERVSIWFGAVLRGDNEPIVIGDDSNIQELSVLHTDPGAPLTIGKNVTVGHQVMLHGCTIGDGSLIGIQSVVLNRSVIFGSPAKVVRELNEENAARLRMSAESYVVRGQDYKANLKRIG